jgi:phytol kinase
VVGLHLALNVEAKNRVMQPSQWFVRQLERDQERSLAGSPSVYGELIRKSLHLSIALVPVLASVNLPATLALLATGTLFYAFAEASRLRGSPVAIVSDITLIASRAKDRGGFVLGPVTLGLGAMLALLLYPEPAATLAIFALAFGDGLASLAGAVLRGPAIPFLRGKTFAGSLACFLVVLLITLRVTQSLLDAVAVASAAAIVEAIPLGNFDNIAIPVGLGFVATSLIGG